jgi:hypothetical protein
LFLDCSLVFSWLCPVCLQAELAIYNPEKAAPLLALADYIGSRQN